MKELTREDALDVVSACMELLAKREEEIHSLYDRLALYEPMPVAEGKTNGPITPDVEESARQAAHGSKNAVAVCGTPLVGRSLMLICPQAGMRIVGITDSGIEGLKLIEKYSPEIVFIDLDVTDIDGLVLVSRAREVLPTTTIVALAGSSMERTLVSAIIAGADEVVGKPLQAKRMINTIKTLMNIKKTKQPPDERIPMHMNPGANANRNWSVIRRY
jgi:CheY-like chemotaxis protein